jgi:hypothetical protein
LQTQYVLDARGDSATQTAESIDKLQKSLDLLHGVVAGVDTAQQQMRAQLDHQAEAIAASTTKHDDTARILQALLAKLNIGDSGASAQHQHAKGELDPTVLISGAAGTSSGGANKDKGVCIELDIDPCGVGFFGGGNWRCQRRWSRRRRWRWIWRSWGRGLWRRWRR